MHEQRGRLFRGRNIHAYAGEESAMFERAMEIGIAMGKDSRLSNFQIFSPNKLFSDSIEFQLHVFERCKRREHNFDPITEHNFDAPLFEFPSKT